MICRLQFLKFPIVIAQVFGPYKGLLSTMDSYSRTVVTTLHPFLFHVLSNLRKVAFTLPMRVLIAVRRHRTPQVAEVLHFLYRHFIYVDPVSVLPFPDFYNLCHMPYTICTINIHV